MIKSHKELIVWQKSMDLVTRVYEITNRFPKEEIFGLSAQMRRSAISIPSNIAEGRCRGTKKDYVHFLRVAAGSTAELETQVIISRNLKFISEIEFNILNEFISEVTKMLNSMIRKL
jgi:four helix bundle protein